MFVKRALECALKEAIRRKDQRANADHEYWLETERLAANALAPLRELVEHMKPDGLKFTPIWTAMHLRLRMLMLKANGTAMDGKGELAYLLEAADAIACIRAGAVDFRKTRPKVKGTEIEHDKHGFVYRLAEGWIFLTGKLPGEGKERNPFLRFVEAAAADAGVKPTGFYMGLLAALDHLKQLERWTRTARRTSKTINRYPAFASSAPRGGRPTRTRSHEANKWRGAAPLFGLRF